MVREVRDHPEHRLLLGAAGAFTFVLSAIKLPSVIGSSSHPTGPGLGAVLFRPPVMALLGTVVLDVPGAVARARWDHHAWRQRRGDGRVGPWTAYGVWRLLRGGTVALFAALALANLATYVTTALQLALAFPDPGSGFAGAAAKFLGLFAVTQLPLAVVEGLLGVLVFRLLRDVAAPQLRGLGVLRGLPADGAARTRAIR